MLQKGKENKKIEKNYLLLKIKITILLSVMNIRLPDIFVIESTQIKSMTFHI